MECISRLWAHRITTLFYRAFQRLEYIHPPMLLLKLRTAWSTEGKWHRKQLIEVWEEVDASVKNLLLQDRSRSNQRVDDGDNDKKKEKSWYVLLSNILINVPPKDQHIACALVNVRLNTYMSALAAQSTNAMSGDVKEEEVGVQVRSKGHLRAHLDFDDGPYHPNTIGIVPCQTLSLEVNMVFTPIDIAASLKWFIVCITASLSIVTLS